jgi:hypothetical protein
MATYIDNDSDSFINIDDFDLNNNGADIVELDNNNGDPTILLSNTPLKKIIKEVIGLNLVLS